jgi:hypothetical protein
VSYDNTTSGLPDTDVQAAIDTLSVAAGVTYDNSTSGLTATNVQAAVDELATASTTLDSYFFQSYQMTGGNDVSVGIYTGSADATERRTLNIPPMLVNIDGETYTSASGVTKDLNTSANWDSATYATASNRNGKDFYLYACVPSSGTAPDFVLSANTTYPTGYTADDSRKVGGFHTLCVSAGTIASAPNVSGYITGDIIPRSMWDLTHRAVSDNEGMRYSKSGKWVDIYLPSYSGGKLVSVYGGVVADGVSTEKFHAYKFDQYFGVLGKKPIASLEFVVASLGANQSTNIAGSSDPNTTGGHTDTSGRRMIDDEGGEDMCGAYWQWGREQGGANTGASWANAYDGNDSGVGGQHYMAPLRPMFGGGWVDGAFCGSRSSSWYHSPLSLDVIDSSRGVSEPDKR